MESLFTHRTYHRPVPHAKGCAEIATTLAFALRILRIWVVKSV